MLAFPPRPAIPEVIVRIAPHGATTRPGRRRRTGGLGVGRANAIPPQSVLLAGRHQIELVGVARIERKIVRPRGGKNLVRCCHDRTPRDDATGSTARRGSARVVAPLSSRPPAVPGWRLVIGVTHIGGRASVRERSVDRMQVTVVELELRGSPRGFGDVPGRVARVGIDPGSADFAQVWGRWDGEAQAPIGVDSEANLPNCGQGNGEGHAQGCCDGNREKELSSTGHGTYSRIAKEPS